MQEYVYRRIHNTISEGNLKTLDAKTELIIYDSAKNTLID